MLVVKRDDTAPVTYVSTLCDAHAGAQAAADLSHVHDASDADHFQHAVVVCWTHELVVAFRTPRVRPRRPAAVTHTHKHTHKRSAKTRMLVCRMRTNFGKTAFSAVPLNIESGTA